MTNTDADDDAGLRQTMYRYMTQELAEQLLADPEASKTESKVKEVSILYADIRGYETLTEGMQPEAVIEWLNQYFETMVGAIFEHKGTLDKYSGGALMAAFGFKSALASTLLEWGLVILALASGWHTQ